MKTIRAVREREKSTRQDRVGREREMTAIRYRAAPMQGTGKMQGRVATEDRLLRRTMW